MPPSSKVTRSEPSALTADRVPSRGRGDIYPIAPSRPLSDNCSYDAWFADKDTGLEELHVPGLASGKAGFELLANYVSYLTFLIFIFL